MDKVWLDSYPPEVPQEIDGQVFGSVGELFEHGVKRFADHTAFVSMGRALTYAELDRLSAAFAAYLQKELGLQKGARVALMMPNVLQYPVALFGALRAGFVVVNVNPLYKPRELEHQLKDSGAEAIVILENFAHTLEKVIDKVEVRHVIVTSMGDMLGPLRGWLVDLVVRHVKKMVPAWQLAHSLRFSEVLKTGASHRLTPAEVVHDDVAFLQYTGGTTGWAKGAVLTHGNILSNLEQAHAWIRSTLREGEEVIITALPLYHIFSLTANCLTFFKIGATNVLIANPRDIPGFVKELRKHRFTAMTGVNTLFNALLNNDDFRQLDFSALKITLGGGMAVQKRVAERWLETTGIQLVEAYGLTETSPAVSINRLDIDRFTHSIGLPLPSTEVSIRDEEGAEQGFGEPGELCIKGPQVMREYWNMPEETEKSFTSDGFFQSGDIATIDEKGYLTIVDRKKDIIIVSGFNVIPNEVEDVLANHPDVLEAAAVGVPDEHSGETVKVFVVPRKQGLSKESVIAHCKEHLTGYKVPHHVEFRDELPKSNVGKILRRQLRDDDSQKGQK